ncbi:MAG TPA: YIP1 family protein [Gaiellaceae bacterium]
MSWWKRAPAVLLAPRPVFVALRDDSVEDAEDRQEPLAALICLAGIAVVLASPTFRRMLNDASVSLVLVPVLAFIAGALYGVATYWLGGGLLFGAARRLGSLGDYRRARHTLALASAPLALALFTFWPVRLAIYGRDLFRTGGDDYGRGDAIFGGVFLGLVAWSLLLLLIGVRSVHGWSWPRAAGAVVLAAAFPALIIAATSL